jgi:hypothetical protein
MMNCGTISFHYPGGIRKERSACNWNRGAWTVWVPLVGCGG